MPFLSAVRCRSAARNPDRKITKLRFRGHSSVYVRRTISDLAVLGEIMGRHGVYDEALSLLYHCETFIDLGANIGVCSLLVLEKFPNASVYAFEPHPETFSVLQRNLNRPNCFPIHAAAWSQRKSISLSSSSEAFDRCQVVEGTDMEALPIAEIIAKPRKQIDFLKIDVEGAEVELFKKPCWLDLVNMLAIEFHGDSRLTSGFDFSIKKHGLAVVSSNKHTTIAKRVSSL